MIFAMQFFTKVFNITDEGMVLSYLTIYNIFDNGRTKHATHLRVVNISFIYFSLRIIAIIIVSLNVRYLR